MTRAGVIVTLWLVVTAAIGDAALAGGGAVGRLLAFQVVVTALAAIAAWLELGAEKRSPAQRPGARAGGAGRD